MATYSSVSSDMDGVTSWTSVASRDEFYLAWGLKNGTLVLAQFNGPHAEIAIRRKYNDPRLDALAPYKLKHFVSNRYLWLVVAYEPLTRQAQHTVAVYQINGTLFKQRQIIESQDYVDIDVLQVKGDTFMALSSGPSLGATSANKPEVSLGRLERLT